MNDRSYASRVAERFAQRTLRGRSRQRDDLDISGLLIAKRETIAAHFEGDGIAQRRSPEHFDRLAIAKAHFQETAADLGASADFDDLAAATDAQFVERAGGGGADVRASGKIAGFFHDV